MSDKMKFYLKIIVFGLVLTGLYFATSVKAEVQGNTNSLYLNKGFSTYVDIPIVSDFEGNFTQSFSFEFWGNFVTLPVSGETYTMVSKWDQGDGETTFKYYLTNVTGQYRLSFCIADQTVTEKCGYYVWTPEVDTWYHLGISFFFGTDTAYWFINGNSVKTQALTNTSIYDGDARFLIGAESYASDGGANFSDMLIDEFRWWSKWRSPQEILSSLAFILYGNEPYLSNYYRFDSSLEDSGPYGKNLYPHGLVSFDTAVPFTPASNIFYQENEDMELANINPFYFWITFFVLISPWLIVIFFVFWVLKILTSINPRRRL